MGVAQPANPTIEDVIHNYDRLCRKPERRLREIRRWERDAVIKFLRWCNDVGITDPNHFMWYRFSILKAKSGHHRAHPSLRTLCSDALVPTYLAVQRTREHERRLKMQMDGQRVRTLITLANAHEIVRRNYLVTERTDLCVAQPSLSGGYHPHSQFCPACPRAWECARALNEREGFDVVALRLGRFDDVPADVRAGIAV